MATPYSDLYNSFLAQITDYDLPIYEEDVKTDMLNKYMISACSKFLKICKEDLNDRDDISEEFTDDLTDDTKDILIELMVVEWLKPRLYNTEFFKNVLNTKDFNQFSPANLLKEIRQTYILAKANARNMMINYSYQTY